MIDTMPFMMEEPAQFSVLLKYYVYFNDMDII